MTPSRQSFDVVPPDPRWVWGLCGLMLLTFAVVTVLHAREIPRALIWPLPLLLGVAALMWPALFRRKVEIIDGDLRVAAGFNSRRVALADIDAAAARIVDLREHTQLAPAMKAFGTAFPGYAAGHFILRDHHPAFVLVSTQERVLLLPTRDGKRVLLSLAHPQTLLDALARATSPHQRR